MMRWLARRVMLPLTTLMAAGLLLAGSGAAQDERTRVFNAPPEKVWAVTISVLESLGWKIDKEDRAVGWLVTKSRGLEGEDYGVYAKGTKHRLRIVIKGEGSNRTEVTVERRVWKEERILWVDKEEDVPATDRTRGGEHSGRDLPQPVARGRACAGPARAGGPPVSRRRPGAPRPLVLALLLPGLGTAPAR